MHHMQRFLDSIIREMRTANVASRMKERLMPMLFWLPVIVMAGLYQALSDDLVEMQRACAGAGNRKDA